MAFTRKMLKALGIADEAIEQIMESHTEVTGALIAERDGLKTKVDELTETQKQLEKIKGELATAQDELKQAAKDDYKAKYETEKAAHEQFRKEIAGKETAAKIDAALFSYLKEKGYSENGAKKIVKYGGYRDKIKLGEDGKAENIADFEAEINSEWGEYKGGNTRTEKYESSDPVTDGSAPEKSIAAQYYAEYRDRVYGKADSSGTNNNSKEG